MGGTIRWRYFVSWPRFNMMYFIPLSTVWWWSLNVWSFKILPSSWIAMPLLSIGSVERTNFLLILSCSSSFQMLIFVVKFVSDLSIYFDSNYWGKVLFSENETIDFKVKSSSSSLTPPKYLFIIFLIRYGSRAPIVPISLKTSLLDLGFVSLEINTDIIERISG